MLGIRLVGSGGMLPQEKFMKIWCSWMASGAILGLKHLCFNLAIISNRIHFMTTRMEIGVYRHQWFQVHLLNWAKKQHTKPVNILLRWILFHWGLGWNDWGVTGRGSHSFLWHPHKLCGPSVKENCGDLGTSRLWALWPCTHFWRVLLVTPSHSTLVLDDSPVILP